MNTAIYLETLEINELLDQISSIFNKQDDDSKYNNLIAFHNLLKQYLNKEDKIELSHIKN